MALPQVGLEAVIANLSQFNNSARAILKAYDDINHKANAVEKATGSLGTSITGLGSHLLNLGAIAGGAALAGVTALGAGLATFAVTGINKAIDLDAQMATIAATMNTTKEAVGPLKDLILDLALDPKLTVNTTQAADAIQLLAQNGATADQIMGGLAKSTVALANATGAQFSTAADVASGILKVFNLDVKDMGQAIDGITGVVNQSKFTIDDYAQAFAQAGSVAAGMGVNLQDFNTVIAATANSFTSGSDAGTSFKTLLQRLANPTDEVRAVTEKYGISLFDAEGNMRPLAEVAGQLNTVLQGTATITETVGGATKEQATAAERASKSIGKLTSDIGEQESSLKLMQDELGAVIFHYGAGSLRARKQQLSIDKLTNSLNENRAKLTDYQGAINLVSGAQEQQISTTKKLTEAEKAELAAVIGGADAARIVLALSQVTADQFDTLSGSVNDVGQAFRAAATRVDSVKGAFDIFKGIIEAVQIQVGDKFLPILRGMTVGFTDLASKHAPMIVEFFGQVSESIGSLINVVKLLATGDFQGGIFGLAEDSSFIDFLFNTRDIALSLYETFRLLVTGDFRGGIFGLEEDSGFIDFLFQIRDFTASIIPFVMAHFEEFKGALIGIGAVLGAGIFAALVAGIIGLVTPITLVIGAAALLGAAWAGNWGGIQEKTFAVWAVVQPILQQIVDWLQINIPIAVQATVDFWNNILLPALAATGAFIMETVVPAIIELWTWLQTNIPIAIQTVTDFWNNSFLPAMATVGGFITTFIATLINLNTWLGTNIALAIQTVSDIWTTVFMPVITGVWTFIDTLLIPLFQSVANVMDAVLGLAITALAGLWQNVLLPVLVVIWHYYTDNIITIFNEVARVSKAVLGVAITALTKLWKNTLLPAITSVWDFISGTLIPIFAAAGEAVDNKVAPPINVLTEKVLPALTEGLTTVVKWIKEATGFFNDLAKAVSGFKLPDVLTPGSPPPMALALQDIASAASGAGSALGNFSQATLDALLGVRRGVSDVHSIIGAARDDLEKFFDSKQIEGSKAELALRNLNTLFHQNATEILNATDRAEKFREIIARSGVSFAFMGQGGGADVFTDNSAVKAFINAFDKRKRELLAAQRSIFIEAGKTALTIGNKLNDIVEFNVEVLDERVKTLQEFIASGAESMEFKGQMLNQWLAQIRLNEALEEQREIQDDILQLKQNEQKLSFLEKQLSLVETLNEAGLNVQDILGGISLGLNASIPDMIEATNRLVQAMIDQVNADLQLGSPSKVMMEKGEVAGASTGMGFVKGLMATIPNISEAMKKAIFGPSVSGPALSGGSSSRVTNNNFNMSVNSGASPQSVMQQFEVARGMVG